MIAYEKTYSYRIKPIDRVFEVIIPNTGKKWQTDIRDIFDTYYGNYLVNDSPINRDVIFLVDKKTNHTKLGRNQYVVPFKKGRLDSIAFGYLLKDIFLKHVVLSINKRGGLCLHASVSSRKGQAVLFVGPSGRGKSTITRLLSPALLPIADDSIFVIKKKNYTAYQPCWFEKQIPLSVHKPIPYPIKAICFLIQSKTNKLIAENDKEKIIKRLVDEVLYLDQELEFKNLVALADSSIPFYNVYFNLNGGIRKIIVNDLFRGA